MREKKFSDGENDRNIKKKIFEIVETTPRKNCVSFSLRKKDVQKFYQISSKNDEGEFSTKNSSVNFGRKIS